MTPSAPPPSQKINHQKTSLMSANMFWAIILGIFGLRLAVIAVSPLGPGVDEAQYWLWGQTPQFGYFSKPPLIAWLLGTADAIAGQSVFSLRAPAPILHLIMAILLWRTGSQFISKSAGQFAALFWMSLPAVGLGSFVISTDTVMLPLWISALYCLLASDARPKKRMQWLGFCGLAIGIACLAKYAALYFILCLIIWLVLGCTWPAQARWRGFLVFLGAVIIASSPTWIWNLSNGLVTFIHLSQNANFAKESYSFISLTEFLASQFGAFGPLSMMALLVVIARRVIARGAIGGDAAKLVYFIWPILLIISLQAFISEANANWAVASYPAACLLIASMIPHLKKNIWSRFYGPALIGSNVIICAGIAIILAAGSFGPLAPKSDPLRRLRGWDQLAEETQNLAQQTGAGAIIAYSRASAALLHWHLPDSDVAIILPHKGEGAKNHYQRAYPLTDLTPRPLLALTKERVPPINEGVWQGPLGVSDVHISAHKNRTITFWLAN